MESPCELTFTEPFWPAAWPIDEPETTSSTRRFCCRPDAVSFEAMGLLGPNPCVVIVDEFTPWLPR